MRVPICATPLRAALPIHHQDQPPPQVGRTRLPLRCTGANGQLGRALRKIWSDNVQNYAAIAKMNPSELKKGKGGFTAPFQRNHSRIAFDETGKYLSSINLFWIDLIHQRGGSSSTWDDIVKCRDQFYSKGPSTDVPHLLNVYTASQGFLAQRCTLTRSPTDAPPLRLMILH